MALFKNKKDRLQSLYNTDDAALQEVAERFSVAVTDDVIGAMQTPDMTDPVARQYIPSAEELVTRADESEDPIGDQARSPIKGIVHRYPDRVLLMPVQVCAVYCRFCFRREKVGPGAEALSPDELAQALDYIRSTPSVWEVIVTGGDPFVLSARRLRDLMNELNAIDHVKVIRFHTRVPMADPLRVTDDLVRALDSDKAVYVVVHCNHAQELTPNVQAAVRRIQRAGIPMLSQSALLKGVNDTAEALEGLFRALVAMRIKPYYLHHPDRAQGTSHFRVSLKQGRALMRGLWGRVSGLAQPTYVLDIPGGYGKVPVAASCIAQDEGDSYSVTDHAGKTHVYADAEE